MENQSKTNSPKINSQNKKDTIKIDYRSLEAKLIELRDNEAIYVPLGHLKPLQEFLQKRNYKIETIYQAKDFAIKYISGKTEIYVIEAQTESWLLKNCNVLLKVSRSNMYTNIFKVLNTIRYKYHIGELIYSFEEK